MAGSHLTASTYLYQQTGLPEEGGGGAADGNIGFNFDNRQFEDPDGLTGYATYKDVAGVIPVDGTGGSALVLAMGLDSAAPLTGLQSMVLSKSASNGQGEGVSYDFTIDDGVRGVNTQITFLYETSGTYVDGDLSLFIWDKTNSVLIYPSISALPGTYGSPSQFTAVFYSSVTSGDYRLVLHVTSTNASAWTAKIDNIQIGQKATTVGAVISEWRSYTPTFSSGFGTVVTSALEWRRNGSDLELRGDFLTGIVTANPGSISLPPGLSIKKTVVQGSWRRNENTGATSKRGTWLAIATQSVIFATSDADTPALPANVASNLNSLIASSQIVYLEVSVPISQWTSNVNLTEDFTEYASNSGSATSADDNVNFAYGPDGSPFYGFTTTIIRKVSFKNPIQDTDEISIEVKSPNGRWLDIATPDIQTVVGTFSLQNTYTYGIGIKNNISGGTTLDVCFGHGRYNTGTTYGANAAAWNDIASQGYRWRVRKVSNGNMAEISGPGTAQQLSNFGYTVGRNKLINGNFDFWQRGTSVTSSANAGYLADRWSYSTSGGPPAASMAVSKQTALDLPFNATNFSRWDVTNGGATAVGRANIDYYLENVSTLAGKQSTFSFWAKANAAKPIAIAFSQIFGTGGSAMLPVASVALTIAGSAWQKYTCNVTWPSIAGKTLATAGIHETALWIRFYLSAGTDFTSVAPGVGIQTGTFDFAQVQLEEGSVATKFEERPYGLELALCQRYYEAVFGGSGTYPEAVYRTVGTNSYPGSMVWQSNYVVPKRRSPSTRIYNDNNGFGFPTGWTSGNTYTVNNISFSLRASQKEYWFSFNGLHYGAWPTNPYIYDLAAEIDAEF